MLLYISLNIYSINIEYALLMFACLECLETTLAQEFCDSFQLRMQCLSLCKCVCVYMYMCVYVYVCLYACFYSDAV